MSYFQFVGNLPCATPSTFDEAWNLIWNIKYKFNSRTGYDELNRYQNHLKKSIGNLKLEEISPFILEQLKVNFLNRGLKPQTVLHILGIVKRVYNQLIQWNLFQGSNPSKAIKVPKEDNRRQRYLTHDEAHILLAELKARSQQLWQISLLSLSTGMRAGEIFNLKGEHVDLTTRTIRVVDPKSKKNRTVYLPSLALEMMAECSLKHGRFVFTNSRGQKCREVSKTFRRRVEALGLNDGFTDSRDKLVFHSLRHTFASWLVQKDQSIYLVSELMGHSSLEMTSRYAHLSTERKSATTDILDSCLW